MIMRSIYSILLACLFIGFIGCSSDDKEDDYTKELKDKLRVLNIHIEKQDKKIEEQSSYCQGLPTNREQLACEAEFVAPLLREKQNLVDQKEEIEKELGIK